MFRSQCFVKLCVLLTVQFIVARALRGVEPLESSPPYECLCTNKSLCAPLRSPLPQKEIYAFQVHQSNWVHYDWKKLTTIVLFNGLDPQMLCEAHKRNIRVVWGCFFGASQLGNATAESEFVDAQVARVVASNTDGLNFDFEDPLPADSVQITQLTALVHKLSLSLKKRIPFSSFSVDVVWSPNDIDGRYYDYTAITAASDFVVIMDYDTRSQVFSPPPCYGGPNAAAYTLLDGIALYLNSTHLPASKFVLGVPWYGYSYECIGTTNTTTDICMIKTRPFRGVPCSDAAGSEVGFNDLMKLSRNKTLTTLPLVENTTAEGNGLYATFDFVPESGGVYKVWLDTPNVLRVKYQIARQKGMRGIAMWAVDYLSADKEGPEATDTLQMWEALNAFLQ